MQEEQDKVTEWMSVFGQETPDKPMMPSLEVRKLRAKLILEEALETIEALGVHVELKQAFYHGDNNCSKEKIEIEDVEFYVHANMRASIDKIADGIADSLVVQLGTAVACGIDIKPIFDEVMRSNWSKAWTGHELKERPSVKGMSITCSYCKRSIGDCICDTLLDDRCWVVTDASGKVIKSPSYSPANIILK